METDEIRAEIKTLKAERDVLQARADESRRRADEAPGEVLAIAGIASLITLAWIFWPF